MTYLLLTHLFTGMRSARHRLVRSYRDDGYSTETILVASLLVVLAIAVLAILATAVTDKANDINLDAPAPVS
ncbi:hypothetical protein KIF24_17165 [Micromonospora sp. Llam7]|uniref:hypothetical protein n=1 Tax=Micromonospora tarapacensis TaxID=2835305 RepID=UPI001C8310CA|nr:hypothetical protein [Micromonospora tarapacensis]MBX7267594.1 hypothetical protein [Micromonospora tarapacensis]